MEKRESPELPEAGMLPRPMVLRPEDLASVAAAGVAMNVSMPAVMGRVLIAGGIQVSNSMF